MIIYMATNKVNGKSYVGQTVSSLKKRKQQHISCSLNDSDNLHFHNAIKKHGFGSFDWTILDECGNIKDLSKLEIHYIKLYSTFEKGYNLTRGGDGGRLGFKHSEKSKLRMSLAKKGKKPSEATIRGRKNKKVTEETKRKLSEMNKGKNNPMYGTSPSEETLKKISGKNNHGSRGVLINGNYFSTLTDAAKSLGVVKTTITNRLKRKVSGYSYVNT